MTYVLKERDGVVTVTDAALTQIVVQSAEAVDGARVRRSLRRRRPAIEIENGRAHVELELAVRYGKVLPEVAGDVQVHVASALGTMCGVDVTAVDVSVEELDR
jgi:uncharacterized alkaline shock family protein YloU